LRLALAGKGGSGKTTLAALAIGCLVDMGYKPLLAIDADPLANLGQALGLPVELTVADIVDEVARGGAPSGLPKEDYISLRIRQVLAEGKEVDLLVMGRPEGPGCYCYANSVLRRLIDELSGGYRSMVLDNEAGLEHLSRRTTGRADALVVVSDATVRGIRTAHHITSLARKLALPIGSFYLVVNKVVPGCLEALHEEVTRSGLVLLGTIPYDPGVAACDLAGQPLAALPQESPAVAAVRTVIEELVERCRASE